ncbi:uncharacterized protein LOC127281439 [Leptopilina boulardi]|uniref:uncharacterized protein LOC127281439 n=1 Tax=Leptopilina boulardi TaxID=63433 RepID=UPI0021F662B4|nr:uncharacterized protein LOC127281439 [Leptopilina boulardi]
MTHQEDISFGYHSNSLSSLLGDLNIIAERCLQSLLRRISKNQSLHDMYHSFLQEYEHLNHMTHAQSTNSSSPIYYLPHHGILREQSTTTKLRVVFNGSSVTGSGISLNDILHTGAKLQKDISDILLWTRKFRFIFSTDITKMFRQIKFHPLYWDLQRILCVNKDQEEVPYQLTTVSYGTKSAPFLSVRAILQLTEDVGHDFLLAVRVIKYGRYVDDIYGGSDQLDEIILIAQQVKGLVNRGRCSLAKWQSNHPELINLTSPKTSLKKLTRLKTTSQRYLISNGVLKMIVSNSPLNHHFNHRNGWISKRIILSEVVQLFDPLGFLSPFTVRAKMLLQEL